MDPLPALRPLSMYNVSANIDPATGGPVGGGGGSPDWGSMPFSSSPFGATFGQSVFSPSSTDGPFGSVSNPSFGFIGGGSAGGSGWPSLGGGQQTGTGPWGSGSGGSGPVISIGGGSGSTRTVGNTSSTSNWLGLPSISWGRIACFLLGLLLITGGIFLILGEDIFGGIKEIGKTSLTKTVAEAA